MQRVDLAVDVLVAGGGMAGVCAALSAARGGARTLLVQDRSRLGGNASSEVRMHIVGADRHGSRAGWREGGLIEEIRLEDAVRNPHRAWELFDLTLSGSDSVTRTTIRAPQPETARDYSLVARTAQGEVVLAGVTGNHQRLRRHAFEPQEALAIRLRVSATNGSEQVRVFEIRCYA